VLLSVQSLTTYFSLDEGIIRAVDDVSFSIDERETVALVGESGCGKTIVALSIVGLVPQPGEVVGGQIVFDGRDLRTLTPDQLRRVRGGQIGMVFQEPGAALNPVLTIGSQIVEVLQEHRGMNRREAATESVRLLGDVGIPEPEKRCQSYPFQLSGGMRQRALIAIATCTRPKLLIADEPTTALDVTVQAEILDLLRHLQDQFHMATLLITHDLGVVAEMAQRVLVMYTGKLFETAPTVDLFRDPQHPYSQGLLHSVPRLGAGRDQPLEGIPGSVPDLLQLPTGCTFHPRCPLSDEECGTNFPPFRHAATDRGRGWACYKAPAP
jgi:oligopeptide/dipeptide ABC transporter ATP-binding protein